VGGSKNKSESHTSPSSHKFMTCVVSINLSKSVCIPASGMDNIWALLTWGSAINRDALLLQVARIN